MTDRIPLSFHQMFLAAFDQGEPTGPIGPRYHLVDGWLLRGGIDPDVLRAALDDVVARHEALRTVIAHDEAGAHQVVQPPSPVRLEVLDLTDTASAGREHRAEQLLNEVESREFDVRELPLMRAVLGRFAEDEAVLVLQCHHTAVDGWSMRALINDLAACYGVRRGFDLPLSVPTQYREHALAQSEASPSTLEPQLNYWKRTLDGAQVSTLQADHPRSAGRPRATAVHRFEITPDVVTATADLARASRSTPFMVLLAAFAVQRWQQTGDTDLVVPTFTPGRSERHEKTVGAFFNFLPIRLDLAGATTFQDVLGRTRTACFSAYSNDIPTMLVFSQAPDLMAPAMTDDRVAFVFQVFVIPEMLDGSLVGDLELTELHRRLLSQPVGSDVPGVLWTVTVTPDGSGIASVQFNSDLLDEATIASLAADFCRLLKELVTAPEAPLAS